MVSQEGTGLCDRDYNLLLGAVDRLMEPVVSSAFPAHAIDVVGEIFPDTMRSFEEIRLSDRRVSSQISRDLPNQDQIIKVVERHLMDNPIAHFMVAGTMRPIHRLSEHISDRAFRRTTLFQECYVPLDIMRQLVMSLDSTGYAGALTINRPNGSDFDQRDECLLGLLRPFLLKAQDNARLFTQLRDENPGQAEGFRPELLARAGLTLRETEVLRWIAEGKRDAEIALILGRSLRTIHSHTRAILRKLGVETRTAAVQAVRLRR